MRGADEQPVFVIGNPRSGTTLLRLMLTSHPEVCIPPEAGFAVWLHRDFWGWAPSDGIGEFLDRLLETRKFEHWGLGRDDLEAAWDRYPPEDYGGLAAAVYLAYRDEVFPDASIWGDKNNYHVAEIPTILEIFPAARFVHIVRDGRNVAASYRSIGHDLESSYAPRLSHDPASIAREWSGNVARVEGQLDALGAGRSVTIRLEDLRDDPETALGAVCAMLDIWYDPAMLSFHRLPEGSGGEPAEYDPWKAANRRPLSPGDRERFQEDLTRDEIAAYEQVDGTELERFG